VVVAAWLSVALTGCATVVVEGPAGDPVKLVPSGRVTTQTRSLKLWYMFWGLMPLSETSLSQAVQDTGFKVVRIEVRDGLDDWLFGLLGIVPFIPFSRTVYLHGE
jgi:hypothetical protein